MSGLDQAQQVHTGTSIEEEVRSEGEQVYVAPPWKLMWWRFRKHKMALLCSGILIVLYYVAIFCEFVAPYDPDQAMVQFKQVPPARSDSTQATFLPSWAARIAPTYPAGPPPMTMRS